jgi:hypothetical protein
MHRRLLFGLAGLVVLAPGPCWGGPSAPTPPLPAPVDGNAVIRAPAGSSEIVLTTTSRLAGAIHSLTWNGREFIDSHDHGRQLQSAASFDCAQSTPFWAERFNPTEAGSRADGIGATSSSRLLELTTTTTAAAAAGAAGGPELRTRSQLAFWLAPGEESYGRPALNRTVLSDHRLAKRVRLGHDGMAQVLEYDVTFTLPSGEDHTYAQFEALTGYMPPDFSRFWTFRADTGRLEPLDDGPGEQPHPVVFSTADAAHAMGILSAAPPPPGTAGPGYGRFRFEAEKVVKWNCVFRAHDPDRVRSGEYPFRLFVVVGTLEDVRQSLATLTQRLQAVPERPRPGANQ